MLGLRGLLHACRWHRPQPLHFTMLRLLCITRPPGALRMKEPLWQGHAEQTFPAFAGGRLVPGTNEKCELGIVSEADIPNVSRYSRARGIGLDSVSTHVMYLQGAETKRNFRRCLQGASWLCHGMQAHEINCASTSLPLFYRLIHMCMRQH